MNTTNAKRLHNNFWWIGVLGLLTCLAMFQVYVKAAAQAANSEDPRLEEYEKPGVRFDMLVRDDFFAGLFGDMERLDRGMQFCEKVSGQAPASWPGTGVAWRWSPHPGERPHSKGDTSLGNQLFQRGLKEMDDAEKYEPDDMGVKIGRAATLIGISESGFDRSDKQGRELLQSAVLDYEKVLAWQQPRFASLTMHNRGELLFGLASGWSMLGNEQKTRSYLGRIMRDRRGSAYKREAQSWLEMKPLPVVAHDCRGCHVK